MKVIFGDRVGRVNGGTITPVVVERGINDF